MIQDDDNTTILYIAAYNGDTKCASGLFFTESLDMKEPTVSFQVVAGSTKLSVLRLRQLPSLHQHIHLSILFYCLYTEKSSCENPMHHSCKVDGVPRCFPSEALCNNSAQCDDGSDESAGCEEPCPRL